MDATQPTLRPTPFADSAPRISQLSGGQMVMACGLLTLVLLSVTSGCTSLAEYRANGWKVGPNYLRPNAATAPDWIDAADRRVDSSEVDMSHWWSVFNDPVLENLVNEAEAQNLTLREAGFRILQARAFRGIQAGNLFPQSQTMFGNYTRTEISKKNANTSFIPQRFLSQFQVGFSLAWELDFWGRYRRAIEAADAELDASVEGYDAVLVTLQGDIADTYVQMRTIEREIVLVRANIALQRETLQYTEERAKAGLTSDLDLYQAQSNVAQTEALLPQFEADLRLSTNRLSVLLGIPPTDLAARLGAAPIPTAPERVAIGIPADLLARRPDVRRAERLAAAQCARIGIAVSDLYPRISINGTIGSSAALFGNLLHDQSFFGNIGPAYQWNILNYGRIRNNVRQQDARFHELVTTYQQTVLTAAEEAENGLVRFLKAQERAEDLTNSVKASQKAVELAVTQYRGGLVDFNRVSLLQLNLVQQQDTLAQAQGNIAIGLIDLYRALGGGWEHRLSADNQFFEPQPVRVGPPQNNDGIPVPAEEPAPAPVPPAASDTKPGQALLEVPDANPQDFATLDDTP